jgi:hypothetical protein
MGYSLQLARNDGENLWLSLHMCMCIFVYAKGSLKEQCYKICGFHYVQFCMCKRKFKGTVP